MNEKQKLTKEKNSDINSKLSILNTYRKTKTFQEKKKLSGKL